MHRIRLLLLLGLAAAATLGVAMAANRGIGAVSHGEFDTTHGRSYLLVSCDEDQVVISALPVEGDGKFPLVSFVEDHPGGETCALSSIASSVVVAHRGDRFGFRAGDWGFAWFSDGSVEVLGDNTGGFIWSPDGESMLWRHRPEYREPGPDEGDTCFSNGVTRDLRVPGQRSGEPALVPAQNIDAADAYLSDGSILGFVAGGCGRLYSVAVPNTEHTELLAPGESREDRAAFVTDHGARTVLVSIEGEWGEPDKCVVHQRDFETGESNTLELRCSQYVLGVVADQLFVVEDGTASWVDVKTGTESLVSSTLSAFRPWGSSGDLILGISQIDGQRVALTVDGSLEARWIVPIPTDSVVVGLLGS